MDPRQSSGMSAGTLTLLVATGVPALKSRIHRSVQGSGVAGMLARGLLPRPEAIRSGVVGAHRRSIS